MLKDKLLAAHENRPQAAKPKIEKTGMGRRGFLGTVAGGFALMLAAPAMAFEDYETGGEGMPRGVVDDPLVFIQIADDGQVTIVASRPEMGTGVRTSLPMVIAEELGANWDRVTIVQGEGDEPKYGNQNTDGSRSTRHLLPSLRQMGASMRLMLERAAAKDWGIDVSMVEAKDHTIRRSDTGESIDYGAMAAKAREEEIPGFDELSFKSADNFKYVGKGETPIYDLADITQGKAMYGGDYRPEGMKFAVVARPPVVGGTVKSFDDTEAKKVAGVTDIIEIEGTQMPTAFKPLGGIAVVADTTYAAIEGRRALQIEWDMGENASFNSADQETALRKAASEPGVVGRKVGDPDKAFSDADRVFSQEYYQANSAHAPMEPPVAMADVKDGHAFVRAPVQNPYQVRLDIAERLGLGEDAVEVHPTLLGGAFGRKSKADFATEAAILSKTLGHPVQVQWTREDDVKHGFYHSAAAERLEAAIDADGNVTGLRHRSASPTLLSLFVPDADLQGAVEQGMGLIDAPYNVANMSLEACRAPSHTRYGWFRSVANMHHTFASQCFITELAEDLGRDPKDFLLEMIGPDRVIKFDEMGLADPDNYFNYDAPYENFPIDTARIRGVIERAADEAGWGQDLPEGTGMGIAVQRSFASYVATVAKVSTKDDGTVSIDEVHTAIDCGYCVNPERVRSQCEGAAVMGTAYAFYTKATFENGATVESNFNDYELPRMSVSPLNTHAHIIEQPFEVYAGGVGEPPLPPVAPAIANAIAAATGKRHRDVPMRDLMA